MHKGLLICLIIYYLQFPLFTFGIKTCPALKVVGVSYYYVVIPCLPEHLQICTGWLDDPSGVAMHGTYSRNIGHHVQSQQSTAFSSFCSRQDQHFGYNAIFCLKQARELIRIR